MDRLYIKRILELREKLYAVYTGHEKFIRPLVRYVLAFVVFFSISHAFPYQEKISGILLSFVLALLGCFLPGGVLAFVFLVYATVQIYFLSPVLAGIVFFVSIVVYLMLLQFAPETIGYVAYIPILAACKMPAFLAIVLGLFFGPASMLSLSGGVIFSYLLQGVKQCEKLVKDGTDILVLAETFLDGLIRNMDLYVMLGMVCATMLLVYLVRRRKMSNSFEIAIAAASAGSFLLLLLGNLILGCSFPIIWLLFGSVGTAVLAYLVHVMHMVLDYGAVEEVQFEDDEYYYYVRAVPKLKATVEEKPARSGK